MDSYERDKFAEMLLGLAEVLDRPLSAIGLKIYTDAVADLEFEQASVALSQLARDGKFFPKPSEVRDLCGAGKQSIEDLGMVEGTKVLQVIGRVGGYHNVVFDDPITQNVIHQGFGGWEKICNETKEDQRKWFLIEFSKLYKAYHALGIKMGGVLYGITDRTNSSRGISSDDGPVLIGDPEKCREVMSMPSFNIRLSASVPLPRLPAPCGENV